MYRKYWAGSNYTREAQYEVRKRVVQSLKSIYSINPYQI